MQPLRHGYTNDTRGDGRDAVKRYQGPDAGTRWAREQLVLRRLHGWLPVPALIDGDGDGDGDGVLRMRFVAGVQGQELMDGGAAARVLRACGETLRAIHRVDVGQILPGPPYPPETVLTHGDYGPNNVLLDPGTFTVTAVLDWEWAHPGRALEDLAWCEWIVRMHHGEHTGALDAFFDAYGDRPPWPQRQATMMARCRALLEMCERWGVDAARLWRHRLDLTASWAERP